MISRILIALVGAFAITASLLLGMNEVAEKLRLRDGTKFFRINDVSIVPSGRWRPDRPPIPDQPPERSAPELRPSADKAIELERPIRPEAAPVQAPAIAPILLPEE
jgi:hypothetical protein